VLVGVNVGGTGIGGSCGAGASVEVWETVSLTDLLSPGGVTLSYDAADARFMVRISDVALAGSFTPPGG
jgi:hypothetical protein